MQASSPSPYIRIVSGCLMVVLGVWGIHFGVRAAIAQSLYFQVRHGRHASADTDKVLRVAERASRLYPHNFYMAYLASDRALSSALRAGSHATALRYFNAAEHWCREGLRHNPYRSEIQWQQVRLLREDGDFDAAIAHWRAFVEHEFWNPDHHAALAQLYLQAGDPQNARQAIQWAESSARFQALSSELEALLERRARR